MKQTKLNKFFTPITDVTLLKDELKTENREPIKKKIGTTPKTGISTPNPEEYYLYFDGCSKGNPGLAGAGAVIYKGAEEIWSDSMFVGRRTTNNVAEYSGLILGMTEAIKRGISTIIIYGDSELVIKQMKRIYKVNSPNMLALFQQVSRLETSFQKITYKHVYREHNTRADALSNDGLHR
jgi:ribonuclease HI